MSMVKMVAIDSCDGHHPGDPFEVGEKQADQLEAKGLAKRAVTPSNKMAPAPANKANPSPAAGGRVKQSASPAAPVSAPKTATASRRGGTRTPKAGV